MKKIVTTALSAGLIAALSLSSCTAFANETTQNTSTNTKTESVFSKDFIETVENADGVTAEVIAVDISSAYENDPSSFLENLKNLNDSDCQDYLDLLFFDQYYGDNWDQFLASLSNKSNENEFSNFVLDKAHEYEEHASTIDFEDNSPVETEGLFDPDILVNAIEAHQDCYLFDDEYCGYLREMYELDPVLFVKTISDLSKDMIQNLEKQIAYATALDLGDIANVKASAYGLPTSLDEQDKAIVSLKSSFETSIVVYENAPDVQTAIEEKEAIVNDISTYASASIGSMVYTNSVKPTDLEINKSTVLTSKISGLDPNTQYKIELYVRHDGATTENLKGSKTYTSNSSGVINASLNVTFSSPGDIWTTLKVYKGTTLVASRTGKSVDTVYARWSIKLPLASNNYGTLSFYYASGTKAYSCKALGQSASNASYTQYQGNTPPGDYYGWTAGPKTSAEDKKAYGENKYIQMEGNHDPGYTNNYVSGGGVTKARSGIWIHGGRSQTSYTPTNGCVRIHDADILTITNYMDSWVNSGYHKIGRVSITR